MDERFDILFIADEEKKGMKKMAEHKWNYESKTTKKCKKLIGKTLDAYHDGKRSDSRLVRVKITDVIQRWQLSEKYWKMWLATIKKEAKAAVNQLQTAYDSLRDDTFDDCMCYSLYDWDCQTFVFGEIVGDKDTHKDPIMFALKRNGGFYGVNWNYLLTLEVKHCWDDMYHPESIL